MSRQRQLIENGHTPSLEAAGFRLQRGWDDQLAHTLAYQAHTLRERTTTYIGSLGAEISHQQEWFREKERTVYALGKQATVSAVSSFSRGFRSGNDRDSDFQFEVDVQKAPIDPDILQGFTRAVHYDFTANLRREGVLWHEIDINDKQARLFYQQAGYKETSSVTGKILVVKRG